MLLPSSNVNITPKLRILILTDFLRFFRRFPQINVGGDSTHLSSFGKRTREPLLRSPAKGHVATAGEWLELCVGQAFFLLREALQLDLMKTFS